MPIAPHRTTNLKTISYFFTASPVPEHPCQDPGRDAGRGQGRLLGSLRHRGPEDATRARAHRDHRRPDQRDGRQVRCHLPLGDEVPDHRPGGPDRLPAVPRRAPQADPALPPQYPPLAAPPATAHPVAAPVPRPPAPTRCSSPGCCRYPALLLVTTTSRPASSVVPHLPRRVR